MENNSDNQLLQKDNTADAESGLGTCNDRKDNSLAVETNEGFVHGVAENQPVGEPSSMAVTAGASGNYGAMGNGGASRNYGAMGNGGAGGNYGAMGSGGVGGNYGAMGNGGAGGNYGAMGNGGAGGNYGAMGNGGAGGNYGAMGNGGAGGNYGAMGNGGAGGYYGQMGNNAAANPYAQNMQYQQPRQNQNQPGGYGYQQPKKRSFESAIGRNIMGILASLLIFAGLILTVRASYEYMNDTQRMVLMYVVSFVLLGIGMVGKTKNKNPFFLSLCGCGVGAVYISIFLTYGYFHAIDVMVLYLMLAAWSVIVYFLGGRGSQLFKIIGQLGILISLIYGNVSILHNQDEIDLPVFILTLILFYILISAFYLLIDRQKGVSNNLPALILNLFGFICLQIANHSLHDSMIYYDSNFAGSDLLWIPLTAGLCISVYMIFLLKLYVSRIEEGSTNDTAGVGWCIYSGVAMFAGIWMFSASPEEYSWVGGLCSLLFYVGVSVINEMRVKNGTRIFTVILLIPFLYAACMNLDVVSDFLGVGLIVIPYFLMAFFKKSRLYMSLAYVTTWIYVLGMGDYFAAYTTISLVFILAAFLILVLCDEIYHVVYKMGFYTIVQSWFFCMTYQISELDSIGFSMVSLISFAYAVSVLLCLICTFSKFAKVWDSSNEPENSTTLFLAVVNIILMIFGCCLLYVHVSEAIHAMNAIFLFVSVSMNIYPLVKSYARSGLAGIYIGIKLTLYLIFVLNSYDAEGYVISLCCLIMAITCIIFGFLIRYKYIRLYGLILALISIVKMVLFDLKFDSTMSRALTIMACGIIAFGISFLYNVIDKKSEEKGASLDYFINPNSLKKEPAMPGVNSRSSNGNRTMYAAPGGMGNQPGTGYVPGNANGAWNPGNQPGTGYVPGNANGAWNPGMQPGTGYVPGNANGAWNPGNQPGMGYAPGNANGAWNPGMQPGMGYVPGNANGAWNPGMQPGMGYVPGNANGAWNPGMQPGTGYVPGNANGAWNPGMQPGMGYVPGNANGAWNPGMQPGTGYASGNANGAWNPGMVNQQINGNIHPVMSPVMSNQTMNGNGQPRMGNPEKNGNDTMQTGTVYRQVNGDTNGNSDRKQEQTEKHIASNPADTVIEINPDKKEEE